MLDLPPAVSSAVPDLYRDARNVEYANVAATAWILYDISITFSDEVEYVWSAPRSIPKICFLFARYFGAISIPIISYGAWPLLRDTSIFDVKACTTVALFRCIAGLLLAMSVEIVMLLRVLALYGNKKRSLVSLLMIYFVELATVTTMMGVTLHHLMTSMAPVDMNEIPIVSPLTGCNPIVMPMYFSFYWVAMIAFQSILFILMSLDMIRVYLSRRGLEREGMRTPLLTVFFRDGAFFYALILATLLINLVFFKTFDTPISQFAVSLHLTVLSLSCSRLILNLRTFTGNTTPGFNSNDATVQSLCFMSRRTAPQGNSASESDYYMMSDFDRDAELSTSRGWDIEVSSVTSDTETLYATEGNTVLSLAQVRTRKEENIA